MNGYNQQHHQFYPPEYLHGIDLFNEGRYWHAHEAWEDIWRISQGDLKLYYQALIQAAAALLHFERNNLKGTRLCLNNALKKFDVLPREFMSLDLTAFTAYLREFVGDLLVDEQYQKPLESSLPPPLILLAELAPLPDSVGV